MTRALLLALLVLVACAEPAPPRRCNGQVSSCDRPLPEVVLPAAHNAMASDEDGFAVTNQTWGLSRQLEDGVRGFLLDTLEWQGAPHLCHGACELGALPLAEALGTFTTFLEGHPDEVVVLFFEDYVSPEATSAAFEESGLSAHLYQGPFAAPFPTLAQLLEAGERVVVVAQNEGPPPEWYRNAWELFWDTPYTFADPSEMDCSLGRGAQENPFLLLNHWLSNPLPVPERAEEVNGRAVLGERLTRCREETGRLPSLVAVDFYDEGDLFELVAELNGSG